MIQLTVTDTLQNFTNDYIFTAKKALRTRCCSFRSEALNLWTQANLIIILKRKD